MQSSIDFLVSSLCSLNQVSHSCLLHTPYHYFILFYFSHHTAQIWGNLISYLVLTPEDKALSTINGTQNNTLLQFQMYDKCGADFNEQEYQGAQVAKKIDRKTV
jgi:hypothetical protein